MNGSHYPISVSKKIPYKRKVVLSYFLSIFARTSLLRMKNILYFLAFALAVVAIGYIYLWYKAEPNNGEPLPALLSALSSLVLLIVAWRMDHAGQNTEGSPKTWFRWNKAAIKGKNIVVKQGTNGPPATLGKNSLQAEGEDHDITQG